MPRVDIDQIPGGTTVGSIVTLEGEEGAFFAVAHQDCVVAIVKPELMIKILGPLRPEEVLSFLGYCNDALSSQLYHTAR